MRSSSPEHHGDAQLDAPAQNAEPSDPDQSGTQHAENASSADGWVNGPPAPFVECDLHGDCFADFGHVPDQNEAFVTDWSSFARFDVLEAETTPPQPATDQPPTDSSSVLLDIDAKDHTHISDEENLAEVGQHRNRQPGPIATLDRFIARSVFGQRTGSWIRTLIFFLLGLFIGLAWQWVMHGWRPWYWTRTPEARIAWCQSSKLQRVPL